MQQCVPNLVGELDVDAQISIDAVRSGPIAHTGRYIRAARYQAALHLHRKFLTQEHGDPAYTPPAVPRAARRPLIGGAHRRQHGAACGLT